MGPLKVHYKSNLPEICKMTDGVMDFRLFSPLMVSARFAYGNRVHNKLEYYQVWYLYLSENLAMKVMRKRWWYQKAGLRLTGRGQRTRHT